MRAHRLIPGRPIMAGLAALLVLLGACLALLTASASPATLKALQFVTQASASVTLGGSISDTGSILGDPFGPKPTGTMTFRVYGPDDPTCANPPVFTSPDIPVTRLNTLSGPFTPTLPGTYRFVATYSGDSVYAPAVSKCNSSNESVLVTEVTPTLTTSASPSVQVGGTVTDTATLTGGKNPTGSIEFGLFPPNDPNCTGGVVFRSTVAISDPASVTSEAYSPPVPGTYHWEARYTGDHVNGAVRTGCGDANEAVVVTAAPGTPGSVAPPPAGAPGGTTPPIACDPATTARAVLDGLTATLTGRTGAGFRSSCSAGLRIVLRAKEIRPGNPGFPRGDGFTTMANVLSHISPAGPALNFSLGQQGLALRDYAQAHHQSLISFLVVHVRPDKSPVSTESLQILTLGIG